MVIYGFTIRLCRGATSGIVLDRLDLIRRDRSLNNLNAIHKRKAPLLPSKFRRLEEVNGALRGAHRPKSGVSANEFTIYH